MREILPDLMHWWQQDKPVALATVVDTWESAPRPPGAVMLVTPEGNPVGSLSGGCVEGAVYEMALDVLETGTPVLERFGVSDDDAAAVGLTCGGVIDVFVERVGPAEHTGLSRAVADVDAGVPVAICTVVDHPDRALAGRRLIVWAEDVEGGLGGGDLEHAVIEDARGLLAAGRSEALVYDLEGERCGEGVRIFVNAFAPKPRMMVFGAIDFAAALAQLGHFLGYRVSVCDARGVFATPARFPDADEVVVEWPHRYLAREAAAGQIDDRTVVAVLTHDPKFDVPLLEVALRLDVGYVGAMGSRRTHEDRLVRLREAGVTEAELARLASPIGLDLGARTPQETAISIAAEFISQRWGGRREPLKALDGPIHRASAPEAPGPQEQPAEEAQEARGA